MYSRQLLASLLFSGLTIGFFAGYEFRNAAQSNSIQSVRYNKPIEKPKAETEPDFPVAYVYTSECDGKYDGFFFPDGRIRLFNDLLLKSEALEEAERILRQRGYESALVDSIDCDKKSLVKGKPTT